MVNLTNLTDKSWRQKLKDKSWRPSLSVFRIAVASLFCIHMALLVHRLHLSSGKCELIGGLFVLLGLFTRPVALVLSLVMATGYFVHHAPSDFLPMKYDGELTFMYALAFLFLSAVGGGSWGLDRTWAKWAEGLKKHRLREAGKKLYDSSANQTQSHHHHHHRHTHLDGDPDDVQSKLGTS